MKYYHRHIILSKYQTLHMSTVTQHDSRQIWFSVQVNVGKCLHWQITEGREETKCPSTGCHGPTAAFVDPERKTGRERSCTPPSDQVSASLPTSSQQISSLPINPPFVSPVLHIYQGQGGRNKTNLPSSTSKSLVAPWSPQPISFNALP